MTWTPDKHFKAGPDHILNGGIIGTLIDCHGVFTAVAQAAKNDNVDIDESLWFVTGTLKVVYLKPTVIDRPVELRAKVVEKKGKKSVVEVLLFSEGIETVKGEVIAIKVPSEAFFNSH